MRLRGTRLGSVSAGQNLDPLWAAAGAIPSLDLRFAESKNLFDYVSGQNLITFTRTSNGTYVGSDGVLRTAVTNLQTFSEEFNNAAYGASAGSVSGVNAGIAPNGTSTADEITSTGGGIFRSLTVVTATVCTASVYAKYVSGGASFSFGCDSGPANGRTLFNLQTGAIISNGANVTSSSIAPVGNDWYRCTVTFTSTSTSIILVYYNATPGSSYLVWGAQLEQSSTAGEYIPTTSVINSAPRFDHNPLTGESLGLLVEEQRTNLLLRSEELDNVLWIPVVGTVTANAETSPAGTLTADKLIAANGGPAGQLAQGTTITSGATVTASVYAKAGGFDRLELVLLASNNTTPYSRSTFNPNTGVITTAAFTSNGGTNASSAVQALSNGWYRFSVTVTYPAVTSAGMRLVVFNSDAANGDGVKGVFLWGAQLEAGAFPTSYIPTTTAAVTRSADVVSITGSAFSSWYRQDEGTMFVDVLRTYSGNFLGYPNIFAFSDGTAANAIAMYGVFGSQVVTNNSIQSGGVGQTNYVAVLTNVPGPNRIAQALAVNSSMLAANGALTPEDSSVAMPVGINRVRIGADGFSVAQWGGHIRRLTYFPQRLPNSVLQSITI